MADVLFNDASLDGQFAHPGEMIPALGRIMALRNTLRDGGASLKIGQNLGSRLVTSDLSFQDFAYTLKRDQTRALLVWLTTDGPYWDKPQRHSDEEYFECNGELVTETALAEGAWLMDAGAAVWTVSVNPSNYLLTPLVVAWRHREGTETDLDFELPNFWEAQPLKEQLDVLPAALDSWDSIAGFLNRKANDQNTALSFSEKAAEDVQHWVSTSPETARRVVNLIDAILKDPFKGIGKPEPLKYEASGSWSRRITQADRVTYTAKETGITILRCRTHYE